jgi:repressor LexA
VYKLAIVRNYAFKYNRKMLAKNIKILTIKQRKVYDFICDYLATAKQSPTVFEIAKFLKVSSLRTVTQYLEVLEKKEFIFRVNHQSRGIRIFEKKNVRTIKLPVVSSAGCDNMAVFAEQRYSEFLTVDSDFLHSRNPKDVVVFRAVGDSMRDAGIETGDMVLTEKTFDILQKDKVVAIIDGMAVIKQINFTENAIILRPMSGDQQYHSIVMKKDFQVFGKVIDVIKNSPAEDELIYEKI